MCQSKDFIPNQAVLTRLHDYSQENRILFHFLETVEKKNVEISRSIYQRENARYYKMLDAIVRTSRVLREARVDHVFFKTVRPYKSTTVDLDMLILGGKKSYENSIKAVKKAGCKLIFQGPMSTTFWDQKADIGIDAYAEIAASSVIYMDKRKLLNARAG